MAFDVCKLSRLALGRQGENAATVIEIDISEWMAQWPYADIQVLHQRYDEDVPYEVETVLDGSVLVWTVTDTDTAIPGKGYAEIRALEGDMIKKSRRIETQVEEAMSGAVGTAPDPLENWAAMLKIAIASATPQLVIQGYYATLEELKTYVPHPKPGETYGVGYTYPYNIYVWDALNGEWVNNGPIHGTKGEKGDQGVQGKPGIDAVRNLLDNSDFANVINQRGKTSYSGMSQYTIDRWRTWSADYSVETVANGWVSVNGQMQQYIERCDGNKVHTLAARDASGIIYTLVGRPADSPSNDKLFMGVGSNGFTHVGIKSGIWHWAALYEGDYGDGNLPEYVPKIRAVDVAECQRYFWRCDNTYFAEGTGYAYDASTFRASIVLPQEMRIAPTMTADNGDSVSYGIKVCAGSNAPSTPSGVSVQMKHNRICLTLSGAYTQGEVGVLRLESALGFSADL